MAQLNDAQLDLEVDLSTNSEVPSVSGTPTQENQIMLLETDNYGAPLVTTIVRIIQYKLFENESYI